MGEPENRRLLFSERTYAVPFGRYQPGGEASPQANEVLVGREGKRAHFSDLLFRRGQRGAFLVTGHRGVGKTIFVKHCLDRYRDEVFERYLNSRVGRATFWDRIGVMVLGVLALLAILMVSEAIEILTLPLSASTFERILILVVLVPLAIVCVYPLLFAREVLQEIFRTFVEGPARATLFSFLATLCIAVAVWLLPPFGAPALSMSRLFWTINALYLWVQSTSFSSENISFKKIWWTVTVIFLVLLSANILWAPLAESTDPTDEIIGNATSGAFLFATGILLRARALSRLRAAIFTNIAPDPKNWYLVFGGFGILASLSVMAANGEFKTAADTIGLAIYAVFAFLLLGEPVSTTTSGAHPRPTLALGAKALLSIVVALQLAHPLLGLIRPINPTPVTHFALREPISLNQIPALRMLRPPSTEANPQTQGVSVFQSRNEDFAWIFCLFGSLGVLYFLEYEWVVRPFVRQRMEELKGPSPTPQGEDQDDPDLKSLRGRSVYHELARLTMPWLLYNTWLPIMTISVNLGFEKLDHRRVVHAMLSGLRDQFQRIFLSWTSTLANLGRILSIFLLLLLVNLVGDQWFEMPDLDLEKDAKSKVAKLADSGYADICPLFRGRQIGAGAVNLICKLRWGNQIFHVLYYNILDGPASRAQEKTRHLIFHVLPYRETSWPNQSLISGDQMSEGRPLLEKGLHLEIYELILFFLFYLAGRWLIARLPILPYKETLRRIDEVLDNLSARTSVTSRSGRWEPAQWLHGWFSDERIRQTEQDPSDPRTVEFVFLQILRDIQQAPIRLAGAKGQLISLPTPEITFVFDELDKLGTRVDPTEGEPNGGSQQLEILHAERKRSMELHKLLADLKNLLSSGPARFIFVGGRNLHDEWLADQTARQPLLTNIFDAEVYLPSLLTDLGSADSTERRLDRNIRRYLDGQIERASRLQEAWKRKHVLPSLALPLEDEADESFIADDKNAIVKPFNLLSVETPIWRDRRISDDPKLRAILHRDFCQFLSYRSVGNPKRLKELLGTFVRPVNHVVKGKIEVREFQNCEDVLAFGDIERFRVQLLARIYRYLSLALEKRLAHRDDKLIISVFFLSDFLFKFHRRAFAWSNLERVDELVHIHRAPDLREVLETIVSQWSERFLHPIRNGMYDFRFRSDLAREVEYISRQSHEEMAAFNFTLDESQALKAAYSANILLLKNRTGREPRDMIAGLGELHEFDQEYEEARAHYRHAIDLLDKDLAAMVGEYDQQEDDGTRVPPTLNILAVRDKGPLNARLYMTWGISRLRLMLQIGMTFELSRDLERAGVEYRNAHTLASSLLLAMLDETGRAIAFEQFDRPPGSTTAEVHGERLHSLKHLNLLFQPVFAEAWVAEKLTGGVDTSVSLVEKELGQLRNTLPFVRDLTMRLSEDSIKIRNSNFSLIAAELHSKAGDLYFFKGRQRVTSEDLERMKQNDSKPGTQGLEGYLLRSHYHYCVALHELRRFVTHRRASSQYKMNIWPKGDNGAKLWPTISPESWPDYVYRAAGGTFNDLAEEMLGRVSLYGLLTGVGRGMLNNPAGHTFEENKESVAKAAIRWLESAHFISPADLSSVSPAPHALFFRIGSSICLAAGTLESWLGEWSHTLPTGSQAGRKMRGGAQSRAKHDVKLIEFKNAGEHDDCARLLVSLHLKLVGAKLLEKGGYLEDAAHELLGACEIVTDYLWWLRMIEKILQWQRERAGPTDKVLSPTIASAFEGALHLKDYLSYLTDVALYSLDKADLLFRIGRRAEEEEEEAYLVGNKIPVAALILTCSLGLAIKQWNLKGWQDKTELLEKILREEWHVTDNRLPLRELLEITLVRHSYPMINRLHGLKILIDDHLLADGDCTEPRVSSWIHELMKLTSSLDAPMHFTPQSSGLTCAIAYFHGLCCPKAPSGLDSEVVRRAAERDLRTSEEMFTLRRSYYENISDLAYLYDDFNDRQIHFNHAVQMAGAEISGLLRYLVSGRDHEL